MSDVTIKTLLGKMRETDGSYVRGVVQTLVLVCRLLNCSAPDDRDRIEVLLIVAEEWRDRRHYPMAFLDALIDEISLRFRPYAEKLQDPRWQKRRLEILSRDNWKCLECDSATVTLHVHHKTYEKWRDPWDYPDANFRTLCKNCYVKEKRSV